MVDVFKGEPRGAMSAGTHSNHESITADGILRSPVDHRPSTIDHRPSTIGDGDGDGDGDGELELDTPLGELGLSDDLALMAFWDAVVDEYGERGVGEPDLEDLATATTAAGLARRTVDNLRAARLSSSQPHGVAATPSTRHFSCEALQAQGTGPCGWPMNSRRKLQRRVFAGSDWCPLVRHRRTAPIARASCAANQ